MWNVYREEYGYELCTNKGCVDLGSFVPGWMQQQTIDLTMAAQLREIGEHKGRAELYSVHTLSIIEALRFLTAEHSAVAIGRIDGIGNPAEQENYRALLLEIQEKSLQLPINADTLKTMHMKLFKNTDLPAGHYRSGDAQRDTEILCASYREHESSMDPILLTGTFVFDFLRLQPFVEGNGRIAQIAAGWLLQRRGYNVSRFVSLERILEETKDEYNQAIDESSVNWRQSRHDIRPWWSYWLRVLVNAYRTFTSRALVLAKRRGVKTDLVLTAIESMPEGFTLRQIQQRVPGCGIELIRKICKAEKAAGRLRCLGRGPNSVWRSKKKWN